MSCFPSFASTPNRSFDLLPREHTLCCCITLRFLTHTHTHTHTLNLAHPSPPFFASCLLHLISSFPEPRTATAARPSSSSTSQAFLVTSHPCLRNGYSTRNVSFPARCGSLLELGGKGRGDASARRTVSRFPLVFDQGGELGGVLANLCWPARLPVYVGTLGNPLVRKTSLGQDTSDEQTQRAKAEGC